MAIGCPFPLDLIVPALSVRFRRTGCNAAVSIRCRPRSPGRLSPAAPPPAAASALRAELSGVTALTDGERHVLTEWLDRIAGAG
jgi:hypothetical protein